MSRRTLVVVCTGLVLLTLLGLGGAAYFRGRQPRSGPGSTEPAPRMSPVSDSFSAINWQYQLRPVPIDGPRPAAEETWRGLFPGMAADPATRELLRRLYGGLPVELVILEKEAAQAEALTAPPGEGNAVVLRLANLGAEKKKTKEGETLFGLIALGRATVIKDAVAVDLGGAAEFVKAARDRPGDGEAFALAAEDYLLRHGTGWMIVGGPIFDAGLKLPAGADEQRADLERRIQDCADRAAAYYGKLRGKK